MESKWGGIFHSMPWMSVNAKSWVFVDERWKISLEVGKDSKQSSFMVPDESIHSRSRSLDQK